MLISSLTVGGIIIGGAIGYACAQAIRVKREADELDAELRREAFLQRCREWEIRAVDEQIADTQTEIARRKKRKKAGEPVTPLRKRIQELTTRKLKLECAA